MTIYHPSSADLSRTSLYLRIWEPADFANSPVASFPDCLPPALALQSAKCSSQLILQ